MTLSNLTTQELIETAVLDALGLLDEDERARFDSSFYAASPELQAAIRREQARVSGDPSLLPDIEPPAELRGRVIQAFRAALVGDQAGSADIAGRIHAAAGGAESGVSGRRRVSTAWRTTTVAFAAAVAVLASLNVHTMGELRKISDARKSGADVSTFLAATSASFTDGMLSGDLDVVAFSAVEGAEDLIQVKQVSLVKGEPGSDITIAAKDLVPMDGVTYALVVEQPGEAPVRLGEIPGGAGWRTWEFKPGSSLDHPEARLAIHAVRTVGGRPISSAVMIA
ncbi:MAG: hypothetical protein AAGB51_15175 [Planctomycetota bacterium]